MRHEQRVFGMITNNSNSSIRYITLNLVFKDQNKKIIDVISGEMYNELGGNGERISGILRPHQSKGFLVKRRIGMFNQPEIDFEGMKAHSVDVTINNFVIVPKTAE